MSSIINNGDTFHGIGVIGRGVFNDDEDGNTYAGQIKGGYACGLGVLTWPDGDKVYAEHGPDGQFDGRYLFLSAYGVTDYSLVERGKLKDRALVYADGRCRYNGEACAPDDPRLLALIAQVAPVEVRPQPQPPTRYSPSTRPQAIVRWIGRLGLPPQALAAAVATEVRHPRRTPALVAVRHNPTAAALYRAILFPRAFLPGFAVWISRSGWQAEEAVANLPLRLAVRVHCGHQGRRGTLGVLSMHSMGLTPWRTLGVHCHGMVHSEECAAAGRAAPSPVLPPARARMAKRPNLFAAGARAARDGAARAEPAAAADGRCRCAARGVRAGAGLAAVGAARDGLRGDREAQGAPGGRPARALGCMGVCRVCCL
jgi:hypothetical protein